MTEAARKALDALDPRQRKAAVAYAETGNLVGSMLEAGYAKKTAKACGPRLLAKVGFKEAVNALLAPTIEPRIKEIEINANSTLLALAAIAHSDPADLIDKETGKILRIHDMPAYVRRAIQEFKVDDKGFITQVKLASKPQALMMLARSQNLLDQPIPPPPPGEDRVAGMDHGAAVDLLKRQSPHLLARPAVSETNAQPVNGAGKHNGTNGKGK